MTHGHHYEIGRCHVIKERAKSWYAGKCPVLDVKGQAYSQLHHSLICMVMEESRSLSESSFSSWLPISLASCEGLVKH